MSCPVQEFNTLKKSLGSVTNFAALDTVEFMMPFLDVIRSEVGSVEKSVVFNAVLFWSQIREKNDFWIRICSRIAEPDPGFSIFKQIYVFSRVFLKIKACSLPLYYIKRGKCQIFVFNFPKTWL
jgi:hypothetical protein